MIQKHIMPQKSATMTMEQARKKLNTIVVPPEREVDPIVDELAGLIHASKLTNEQIAARVGDARKSKMSPETVASIRDRTVVRPQNYTVMWIAYGIGKRRGNWVDI